jgi:hypothetical protein
MRACKRGEREKQLAFTYRRVSSAEEPTLPRAELSLQYMEKVRIQSSEVAKPLQLPFRRIDVGQLSSRGPSRIEAAPFATTATGRISPPASGTFFRWNPRRRRSKERLESPGCQKPQKKSHDDPKESHSRQVPSQKWPAR